MENLIDNATEQTIVHYIPRNATLHSLAEFFSACSDVTRAKIICALSISEMCVTDLSRILGLNQTTCSHQLRLLRAADIVNQRRDGKI
ncbi:MAG: metalloregulator ArsR/SmtB family transcription factor, partial [Clostridia bacterium]|nr:metalloregulator ArsR/SmtB family transcription factor [Clostridia bacterium]